MRSHAELSKQAKHYRWQHSSIGMAFSKNRIIQYVLKSSGDLVFFFFFFFSCLQFCHTRSKKRRNGERERKIPAQADDGLHAIMHRCCCAAQRIVGVTCSLFLVVFLHSISVARSKIFN